MTRFAVSGLVNIETTLKVDGFPIPYLPSTFPFFGINNTVSGVGYNLAKGLTILGNEVKLLGLLGQDFFGRLATETIESADIATEWLHYPLANTAQSVIAFDPTGRRAIFTDLKDVQNRPYPEDAARRALADCDIAVLCNINYSRPLLSIAKQMGKLIATDVHTISSLDDDYNLDFMASADILFMSDEHVPGNPQDFIRAAAGRYGNSVIVMGRGEKGALMYAKQEKTLQHVPAAKIVPVVNTIGAGDSLFASFLHFFAQSGQALDALAHAVVFAGYKVGANGASQGFPAENTVVETLKRIREAGRS